MVQIRPRLAPPGDRILLRRTARAAARDVDHRRASRVFEADLETGAFSNGFPVAGGADTPRVAQVLLRSSKWTHPFNQYLQTAGLGSARSGYTLPPADVPTTPLFGRG